MSTAESTADNGVNVQALLDARDALTDAPDAADFTWRASNEWLWGTHSKTTVEEFSGLGAASTATSRPSATRPTTRRCSPPRTTARRPVEFVLVGLATCLTAGVAAVAQNRNIQLNSVKATIEGDMNILGILGGDPEVRNGFNDIRVHFDIDADAESGRHRGARGPVPEALGGVRRHHQPVERLRHRQLIAPAR